jgi:hypothetical protein
MEGKKKKRKETPPQNAKLELNFPYSVNLTLFSRPEQLLSIGSTG